MHAEFQALSPLVLVRHANRLQTAWDVVDASVDRNRQVSDAHSFANCWRIPSGCTFPWFFLLNLGLAFSPPSNHLGPTWFFMFRNRVKPCPNNLTFVIQLFYYSYSLTTHENNHHNNNRNIKTLVDGCRVSGSFHLWYFVILIILFTEKFLLNSVLKLNLTILNVILQSNVTPVYCNWSIYWVHYS